MTKLAGRDAGPTMNPEGLASVPVARPRVNSYLIDNALVQIQFRSGRLAFQQVLQRGFDIGKSELEAVSLKQARNNPLPRKNYRPELSHRQLDHK
jgi:hypothetical protein